MKMPCKDQYDEAQIVLDVEQGKEKAIDTFLEAKPPLIRIQRLQNRISSRISTVTSRWCQKLGHPLSFTQGNPSPNDILQRLERAEDEIRWHLLRKEENTPKQVEQ